MAPSNEAGRLRPGLSGEAPGRLRSDPPGPAPALAHGAPAVEAEFGRLEWTTHTAKDWPEAVRSVVLVTSPDDSGVAICAWNLRESGEPRDLSEAFTTETFYPTITVRRRPARRRLREPLIAGTADLADAARERVRRREVRGRLRAEREPANRRQSRLADVELAFAEAEE